MAASKARKPAAGEARGLPGIVQLGRQNCSEAKLTLLKIQAAHVARRLGLSLIRAALIARHAFTAGAKS
jgi:hypothetical protein